MTDYISYKACFLQVHLCGQADLNLQVAVQTPGQILP